MHQSLAVRRIAFADDVLHAQRLTSVLPLGLPFGIAPATNGIEACWPARFHLFATEVHVKGQDERCKHRP